ncbi:MAG: ATP-binding cassette domain-containing protein [Chloroflexi bacterium AL-W]|nr:ABC transporter ATP-binding protein [Chloroflexi bacterium AL-N1]NOK68725.1 ATP-binding cassette domain-containing protein [Chloroflexi bacterium AL-N10]NOK76211.1 ATP-binding cassette domain-containing protein [Chloroflexi bacterium AL-N5]NOK84152.1 ATP-binding cassette domain-containing protein [Chloroflexi bacterium AL-W]NOK91349.1 ATP-binding cassette domain-containing protein [Chloroflexi bacterium AL-N15]
MIKPKISIKNLSVVYPESGASGPVTAVESLSLDVTEGELVCLVGPSGCGKTTLLRVLAGLEQPTDGSAIINSYMYDQPAKAMVFQGAGIFPWMTVEQNVSYGLQMRGVARRERVSIAQRWLAEIGLEGFSQAYPDQLSGGMQQRVGLARAFAFDPEVLLMDEPFGALDAQTRLVLQQLLLQQWERDQKTVVFVTHSIEEALTLGDRVYVMSARPGRLIHEIVVPFTRPRDAIALRTDPRFSALFAKVWDVLRDEVERARVAESETLI